MSGNDRKRKPTKLPEIVSSNDRDGQNLKDTNTRFSRMSTNAFVSPETAGPVIAERTSVANSACLSDAEKEASMQRIGKLVQDLFHSDNVKVNAALDALYLNLSIDEDKKKCENIVTTGGCIALVQLVRDFLKRAAGSIPACEVTQLNEPAELETLYKSLSVITCLTSKHDVSRVGITAVGGVETVVDVMKTFPKCLTLQWYACVVLGSLNLCNIGKIRVVETGGIEVLLAAVNNHMDCFVICERVYWVLSNIAAGSKENTGMLISLGGATALAKVRTKWPDNEHIQTHVRKLADLIAAEVKTWGNEDLTPKHGVIIRVGISAAVGVESVVEVMKTFPKCHDLQVTAWGALGSLARCNIGKKEVVKTDGIKILLFRCKHSRGFYVNVNERAYWALSKMVTGSMENVERLITLGGATTVAKVRTKWPGRIQVQTQ